MIYDFNPHQDELMYSVLARFHITSRNVVIGSKETVYDAFSSRSASAVVDLPSRLDMLHLNLQPGTRFTPERMIRDLTLFPFYAPFLSLDRVQKAVEKMKSDGEVHTTVGVMASAIPVLTHMRYCHQCVAEDTERYGEAYWHRSHQVQGINVCHKHKTRLIESALQISQKQNKHEFVDISVAVGSTEAGGEHKPSDHEIYLAEAAAWVLENEVPILGQEKIRQKYLARLQLEGYANFKGQVDNEKFIRGFVGFYGREFLESLHCGVDYAEQGNWLLKLVRKPRAAAHPIRHLLLMRFLGFEPETFFAAETTFRPFGEGPWPCLNKAAVHEGQTVIEKIKVTRDYKTGLPVGTFACACGFVYARRGPDRTAEDKYRIGRIKVYGETWESRLKELALEGRTVASIASILDCNVCTVMNYKKRLLGEVETEADVISESNPDKDDTIIRRDSWLALQLKYPEATRKMLRKMAPADFTWLYRHDKEWLYQHSPKKTPPQKYSDTRVDWQARDQEMLSAAAQVVEDELSGEKKPERITVSMVGKRIGRLAILHRHADKVPLTIRYLSEVTETIEDFQIRRVRFVAAQLRADSELLMEWKIVRKAGLRPGFSEAVHEQILWECKML
ncbi:TnsD family Tn7-like transposition protein [Paenibacillus abyssi]|uniref:Transposon Tn7 transposition protein TnsD C-termianl domain-containing protein n=1 Tax=Paenibacillus abyssi TaxID=1340531 RepID=A0A917D295_9BACL|nr:TnsD family Tn7-like transposition protein [Paenibacillus abyssi]GGG07681.1 hypothetical protein GCM10010916_25720 [Paenibacillus abyssi]